MRCLTFLTCILVGGQLHIYNAVLMQIILQCIVLQYKLYTIFIAKTEKGIVIFLIPHNSITVKEIPAKQTITIVIDFI